MQSFAADKLRTLLQPWGSNILSIMNAYITCKCRLPSVDVLVGKDWRLKVRVVCLPSSRVACSALIVPSVSGVNRAQLPVLVLE